MATHDDELDNGGLAFPQHAGDVGPDERGMTLRDYFAARALTSLLAHARDLGDEDVWPDAEWEIYTSLAIAAYQCADAMIEEKRRYDDAVNAARVQRAPTLR